MYKNTFKVKSLEEDLKELGMLSESFKMPDNKELMNYLRMYHKHADKFLMPYSANDFALFVSTDITGKLNPAYYIIGMLYQKRAPSADNKKLETFYKKNGKK